MSDEDEIVSGQIRDFTRRFGMCPDCTCGDQKPSALGHLPDCPVERWMATWRR